jgi:hypothetical protein
MFGNFIICIMVWRFYTWHASLQLVGMLDLVPMRSCNSRFFFSKKLWRKDTTNKTINNFFYSQQNLISIHLEDHFLDSISHSAWRRRRRRYGTHFQVNTNHTLYISGGPMITTYDCAQIVFWFPGEWKKDALCAQ